MTLLLATIASSMIVASMGQYSIDATATKSPPEVENQASETCLRSLEADLGGDPTKRITSIKLHPRDDQPPGERRVGFAVVMKTRDDVPSRYSGFCVISPGQPPAVHVKEAESFGRF